MSCTPAAVVVKRGGFLSSIVRGLFGTISVVVICGTALALYTMHVVDGNVRGVVGGVFTALPDWQRTLPPAVADAFCDRRAPEYRSSVAIDAKWVKPEGDAEEDEHHALVVLNVTNSGKETVSVLALRLVAEDDKGVPRQQHPVYAATPILIDDKWTGPLLPGATRRIAVPIWGPSAKELKPVVEIADLRISTPRPEKSDSDTPTPPPTAKLPEKASGA